MGRHNYLFLSDLHLSEGMDPRTGKLSRNEDFFYDAAFAGLLVHHVNAFHVNERAATQGRPWKLVINGDIFDFLQVMALPQEGDELEQVTGHRFRHQLTENEQLFGLGTSSRACVWKMAYIRDGHPLFFEALGWFLAHEGNELVLLRGNHDIELFWPAVQARLCELVADSYCRWYEEVRAGRRPDSPLPFRPELPAQLDAAEAGRRIHFPTWFYYEPGLFFVEHGSQYDPANAVVDFLDPVLPADRIDSARAAEDRRLSLPSGSLFVRYFFNHVEQVHPFADNIKPLLRYVRWAITKEPLATLELLIAKYKMLPVIVHNLRKKRVDPIHGQPEMQAEIAATTEAAQTKQLSGEHEATPEAAQTKQLSGEHDWWQTLDTIRQEHRAEVSQAASGLTYGTVSGLALNAGVGFLLLQAIRYFVERQYRPMLGALIAAAAAFVGSRALTQRLDQLDDYVNLAGAAQKICLALNQPDDQGRTAAVRYHIFGHDHAPMISAIEDSSPHAPPFRQWYVNTGGWLPTFNEQEQLVRGDVQFTFMRLLPDQEDLDRGLPELLEWRPETNETRTLRLFAHHGAVGFISPIPGLPDIHR
jgi:UDP-2,3-diacylglucosamine pyrophosphatase LpxH